MPDFTPSRAEEEQVVLVLANEGIELKNFTEYSFNSNFLTPTDGWSFTIGAEEIDVETRQVLVPGAAVKLTINGLVQSSGFIDSVEFSASRSGGTICRVEGRDRLAQAVDACADPTVSLKEGQTLEDALVSIFTPFGWSSPDQIVDSDEGSKNVKTGGLRGKTKRSEAKGFGRRAIKQYKLHLLRPYSREGVFEFASRITQRFGLWIWTTASGDQLVVSTPDFDSAPTQKLIRKADGTTNVLEGSVEYQLLDQPTHIVADSFSVSGEFGHGRAKAILANTTVSLGDDVVPLDVTKYKQAGARVLSGPTFPASAIMRAPRTRVLYLHDDESQTQEQLESFVRREMAIIQRKSLTVNYTVEGHGQETPLGFIPWIVDTTVDVDDEIAGLRERLYVLGRTFNKSRNGGTTTHLELIRLNTLVFSSTGK